MTNAIHDQLWLVNHRRAMEIRAISIERLATHPRRRHAIEPGFQGIKQAFRMARPVVTRCKETA